MTLAEYLARRPGREVTCFQEKHRRFVFKIEEADRCWYAKKGVGAKSHREIRREAANARILESEGFGPPVLASGAHDGAEWLVLADAYECGGLPIHFGLNVRKSRANLEAVGSAIRRFHDAGFGFPDLTAPHTWVRDDGFWIIDSARLTRSSRAAPTAVRARDLAALLFSVRQNTVELSRVDLVRLLRAATGFGGDAMRSFARAVDREMLRLRDRTRWRWHHWACTPEFAVAFCRSERTTDYERRQTGIGADELIDRRNWIELRSLVDRQNRVLMDRETERHPYFAKFYPAHPGRASASLQELEGIDFFQRAGILVNAVGAHVEDRHLGSLVAVKTAAGEPLDDLLRRGVTVTERRALAVQTARIWRRMRECGLRHRDAYPCHLFVAPWTQFAVPASAGSFEPATTNDPAEAGTTNCRFELRLIDLTRAGRVPFPKERWFVKDAAALWHGLPKPPVTRTDAVRWLREYFRIDRLDARAKRFARRVAAKERRIAARQTRKARR